MILFVNLIYAQNPLVKQWDMRFGGIDDDYVMSFQQTADGGFIFGGFTYSDISGNLTQSSWDTSIWKGDFWVIKINSIGNIQWEKRYGGKLLDRIYSLQQTNDGGYILGGYSVSGIGGDKTQTPCAGMGDYDYWIIKIDSLGNKQWDGDYGGNSYDFLCSINQTEDSGYILGGYSSSDSTCDKTQPLTGGQGDSDYWIVKIDSLGNKQWDKKFGGSQQEDFGTAWQTFDGGYIVCGSSWSGISGDKSQPVVGVDDYWIVKTDSLGNKEWDKNFGGSSQDQFPCISLTNDHGFILGGRSQSPVSGDKTQPTQGNWDYWILKLDSLGNKQWDKDFGASYVEYLTNIFQTSDGGFLLSGSSESNASGDKTENNLGTEQTWIVKTDSLGNKQWDKTIFTTIRDVVGSGIQTSDGCYAFCSSTTSGIGGYKSQNNWDITEMTFDFWIVKFCDTTSTGIEESDPKIALCNIYPNPFSSEVSITIQKQNLKQSSFIIKNTLLQTVFIKEENNLSTPYTKTIDLSFLTSGIYLLNVIIDGERTVKKIVKE